MIKNRKVVRVVAIYLLIQFLTQTIFPTVSWALTSGPTQPEFSSFEPVGASNMVDLFTGDFTYNLPIIEVPGPHGSSYPLTLSYHSGASPEEEASWVGYGWSLNAGAINRNTRGLPDDFNSQQIINHNKAPDNMTFTAGGSVGDPEIFGFDFLSANASTSIRYNNYKGFGFSTGVGISLGKGVVSLGYNVSDGDGSFSLDVQPGKILSAATSNSEESEPLLIEKEKSDFTRWVERGQSRIAARMGSINLYGSSYGIFSYGESARSTSVPSYEGLSFNISFAIRPDPTPLPFGFNFNGFGSHTVQHNRSTETLAGFGYMYTAEATGPNALRDYHIEKETSFNKRDVFIGIPFTDADIFAASGNGISGGFRLYNKSIGHFGPRTVNSHTDIVNLSVELTLGLDNGPGVDLPAIGTSDLDIHPWITDPAEAGTFSSLKEREYFNSSVTPTDEPISFRFNNDLAGSWGDLHDDNPIHYLPRRQSGRFAPKPGQPIYAFNREGKRAGRSSYIGFNTNSEITNNDVTASGFANPIRYKAFSKRADIDLLANRLAYPHLIGEIAVFNEGGSRHVYGLPVYSKDEETFSYGVRGASIGSIYKNYLSFYKNEEFKIGEQRSGVYASTYLLTEITTPDYIDVDLNGPSKNDFGGYTKFSYQQAYGGASNWYRWRMPYQGLYYKKNNLSDKMDDLAAVSSGYKEIYYTKSIETKTHVLMFNTGTAADAREDSYGAMDESNSMNNSKRPNSTDGTTTVPKLKKLKQIDLYAYDDVTRDVDGNITGVISGRIPIKSVVFEYFEGAEATKQLAKNNGANGLFANAKVGEGKLTLKRVYFIYNGSLQGSSSSVKVSPYEFVYSYPKADNPGDAKYADVKAAVTNYGPLQAEYNTIAANPAMENPDYSPFATDAWGSYQKDGDLRFDNMRTWVDQKKRPNIDFDPAAYQLKVIKLPSGGQIHIQYEQDDYTHVQNQPAHVMASLVKPTTTDQLDQRFLINLQSIGLTSVDAQELCDSINKRYDDGVLQNRKKMYFKAMVGLLHNPIDPQPTLSSCNAEYITGYVSVKNAAPVAGSDMISIEIDDSQTIRQTAIDFAFANSIGKLDKSNNCDASSDGIDGMGASASPMQIVHYLLNSAQAAMVPGTIAPPLDLNLFNYDLSYFRVPVIKAKKGGGLRVKRLLMYDNTLGTPVLYGNEYTYKVYDKSKNRVISGGVATNEPQTMREENILVDYIPRISQTIAGKIIAGRDKKVSEGPIGESVLPAPSVGYSRVTVQNIHSGKTNPGFSVYEFNTAKEYPMIVRQTQLERSVDHDLYIFILFNMFKNHEYATQGFSFINNSMHGQLKSVGSYKGSYATIYNPDKSDLIEGQQIEYFKPGEGVKVMSKMGAVSEKNPGREVDVTLASKTMSESSMDVSIEFDVTIGFFGIIPNMVLTFVPYVTATEGSVNQHATSKVIHYPAIVKKTTQIKDGIAHVTENIAFDEFTGRPVTVKSYDEFKGAYLSQDIPASWEYANMRPKSESEDKLMLSSSSVSYRFATESGKDYLYIEGAGSCSKATELVTGDLLELPGEMFYHVETVDYSNGKLGLTKSQMTSGSYANGNVPKFRILQTGKNNQLSTSAGSITFHDPAQANMGLSTVTMAEASRYETTNAFSVALQAQVNPILTAARPVGAPPQTGEFTLAGPFSGMNVSSYIGKAPATCTADWTNATISSVKIKYTANQQQMSMQIMEFTINCGSSNVVIKN
jgi:hypothetical protein